MERLGSAGSEIAQYNGLIKQIAGSNYTDENVIRIVDCVYTDGKPGQVQWKSKGLAGHAILRKGPEI